MLYIKDKKFFSNYRAKLRQCLQFVLILVAISLPVSLALTGYASKSYAAVPVTVFAQDTPTDKEPVVAKHDCKGSNIRAGLPKGHEDHCGILDYLVLFIQVLSGIVGIVVVAVIIFSGIQYSASADDPAMMAAAKKRIMNAVIALLSFAFMYALLNYLVPGGVL